MCALSYLQGISFVQSSVENSDWNVDNDDCEDGRPNTSAIQQLLTDIIEECTEVNSVHRSDETSPEGSQQVAVETNSVFLDGLDLK